jgi:predicted ATP-grasp superfamily ATP-dependent carboligase
VGETVLIAAFSGRALAQSARRAGYEPLVADAFGDLDTREAAADFRVIDGAVESGFNTKKVVAALESLAAAAASEPVALVLGSGFEDKPRLISALAERFRLLGSSAETIAACKDPVRFFATLDELGIAHPETRLTPPDDPAGWITKRIGGSGGRHIRNCRGRQKARPRRYFQKRLNGERLSVGGLFAGGGQFGCGSTVAFTRQWISPSDEHPFRFGGCVSRPDVDEHIMQELASTAWSVAGALNLVGMASFDFVVSGSIPYLLEVNPRPGASLDVLDEPDGHLFSAHVAAWNGAFISSGAHLSRPARAAAILHADRGPITLGKVPWPEWSSDRGTPDTFVPKGAPLATAFADAATADAAEALARARLAELEDLIYEHAKS